MIELFACGFFAALGLAIIAIPIVLWVRLGSVTDALYAIAFEIADCTDGGDPSGSVEITIDDPDEEELPHAVGHSRH